MQGRTNSLLNGFVVETSCRGSMPRCVGANSLLNGFVVETICHREIMQRIGRTNSLLNGFVVERIEKYLLTDGGWVPIACSAAS